ncbi:MAG: DUF3874 domain-containing protein [Bacteroidaceae bacterium]|nr:DUF3874 domain-containing protein [Bacteroidaceae bacterium]
MNKAKKFTLIRVNNDAHTLTLRGLSPEAMIESVMTEMKSQPVSRFRKELPMLESLGAGFVHQALGKLPSVSVAASWRKSGNAEMKISAYNGLVLLNVSRLANMEEAETVKRLAQSIPSTYAAFTGSSGKSAKILVSVSLPDGSLPAGDEEIARFHEQAYYLAYTTYSGVVSYHITREEPSLQQHFRMTFDPQPYFNPSAHPLKVSLDYSLGLSDYEENVVANPLERYEPGIDTYEEFEKRFRILVQKAVQKLRQAKGDLETEPLVEAVAKECCLAGFPQEEAIRHAYGLAFGTLDRETVRSIYETVYEAFSDKYASMPVYNKTQQAELLFHRYMADRYVLRFNELKEEPEYRDNNSWSPDFRQIDGRTLSKMVLEARRRGINVTERDILRYAKSTDVPDYNPVDDYLNRLQGLWDGKDHIGVLASRIQTDNPNWNKWFRIWFRGLVAQWRGWNRQYGNSVAPIIIGRQGWRKSTFCRQLLPPELAFGFTDQLDFGNRRDIDLTISHYLLVNIDEFDQLTKHAQNGYLKNLLQRTDSKQRKLFTDSVSEKRRYASFIGTSNVSDLLTDPTGSRRFLCVELTAPIDTQKPVNYTQLYAQAVAELDKKLPYWFTEEEVKEIMESNRAFMQEDKQEEQFGEYFRAPENDDEGEWLSPTEILDRIRKSHGKKAVNLNPRQFGRYLKNTPEIPFRKMHASNEYRVVFC